MKLSFQEALQALAQGECEFLISLVTKCRYMELHKRIVNYLGDRSPSIAEMLGEWELVNPKPLTEAVEVVRWQCQVCGMYGTPIAPDDIICGNCQAPRVVKLIGIDHRPILRKRKGLQELPSDLIACPVAGRKYFEEWEE